MTRHPSSSVLHPYPRSGFTLLEVMISVAIMLFLLIGINQVFSTTSTTIGAGQAASALTRDQKAAQSVFHNDWQGAATFDAPCIILNSAAQPAFLNKADEAGNAGNGPLTISQNGTNTTVNPFTYNYRNHRIDTFSFFSRGNFQRQTGDGTGPIVSSLSSNEAWINYGHLWLPDNSNAYSNNTYPGQGTAATNPNNFYASQWVLGRVAMLLRYDSTGATALKGYYPRTAPVTGNPVEIAPLANSTASNPAGSSIPQAYYDVAETSIDRFRQDIVNQPTGTDWWTPLIYRFQCDPYSILSRSTAGSAAFARTTPYFLSGCSQFIVEYAGDFLSQDSNPTSSTYGQISKDSSGTLIDASDGQIDFYVDKSASASDSTKWVRRTRWYGLPRNVNTSDDMGGLMIRGTPVTPGDPNSLIDVVPLADVRVAGGLTGQANFEKVLPASSTQANYATAASGVYTCVFGPSDTKPKMIRITVTLQDPYGRLANGQTYEYVLGTP